MLWCDFDLVAKPRTNGKACRVPDLSAAIPPEIGKGGRPVVVVSRRYRNRDARGPFLVVPISTVAPTDIMSWHWRLSGYAFLSQGKTSWAKADLLTGVSSDRLTRRHDGKGRFVDTSLSPNDLKGVQQSVLHAMGLGYLVDWWKEDDEAGRDEGHKG